MLKDEQIRRSPTHRSSDYEDEDTARPVQDQASSSKRQRETQSTLDDDLEDSTEGDVVSEDTEDRHVEKRVRYHSIEVDHNPSYRPQYIILHIVQCNRRLPGHEEHPGQAWYSDHPRLFEGDNKASRLRGLNEVPVREDLEATFQVRRIYYCHDYHVAIAKKFIKLHLFEIPLRLQPYSYRLSTEQGGPRPIQEVLQIQDEQLRKILTTPPLPVPLTMNSQEEISTWLAPYLHLYHIRSRVRKLCVESGRETDRQLVELLFSYIEDHFGPEYTEAEAEFARGNVSRAHFHKLFGPDDVIVIPAGEHLRAVKSRAYHALNRFDVQLSCFAWEFDGVFRRNHENIHIGWPDKEKEVIPIASLSAFPLRYDRSGLKDRLGKRGRAFWRCRHQQFVSYTSADDRAEDTNFISTSRYMIDMSTYNELYPKDNEEDNGRIDELEKGAIQNKDPPSEEFALLLPAKIRGFHMEDKKWRFLNIEQIKDIEWNKQAFQRLVLDHDKRKMIEALVTIHITTPADSDIIEGKGNGLIILLHGPPGTGKTLTAESVAELAERPLYRVTCGDIGTDAESVETYLKSVFYFGDMWKAVVLLDESDIFLEERTPADLQRNALVSVFLRALEYYDGILILTSNRVGLFDEAFKSRVQLALYYPPLKEESRWAIWDGFFTDLQDRGIDMEWDEIRKKIGVLARHKLNGRQIRNSIRSARQLAQFEKEKLRYSHLERTIKLVVEFEDYVVRAHGHTDNEYVRATRARYDRDSDDSS